MIGIIDYQSGNIRSLENAIFEIGQTPILVQNKEALKLCSHLILPGVGAFQHCATSLGCLDFYSDFLSIVESGQIPLLGICVGMQILANVGHEMGEHEGLALIPGSVNRLLPKEGYRVPHVGWNSVNISGKSVFTHLSGKDFYFDHSFYFEAEDDNDVAGVSEHNGSFCAIVERENIFGVQFHPEKSQTAGLSLLKTFTEI